MQRISETKNGDFKVVVRVQEFNNSGSENIDVCVANSSSQKFPTGNQCFLNGYEFDGLSIKWVGPRVIQVSFSTGNVSHFTNSAVAYPGGPVPEAFRILLCEGCAAATMFGPPKTDTH
jgi:hypothetical protein